MPKATIKEQRKTNSMDVTILVPVFNEAGLIEKVVCSVVREFDKSRYDYEVLVLDDGSTDWTDELEERLLAENNVSIRHFSPNRGQGAVLSRVFPHIPTRWTVVIDADNEYSAADIHHLLRPLKEDQADWVMGSRYGFGRKRPRQYLLTYVVNRIVSYWFSLLSGVHFNDLLTGLYAFRTEKVANIRLRENRFAYDPELIWKILRASRPRVQDVPISYHFRTYNEGKKIRWWETFTILWSVLKYRIPQDDEKPVGLGKT